MRLTHVGFADQEQRDGHDSGWSYFLDRLAAAARGEESPSERHLLSTERANALARLLREEIALRDHAETVAELRRRLPLGPPIRTQYAFDADEHTTVGLDEMFGDHDELLMYHYMFDPDDERPCPMCTLWVDGFNAIAPYVRKRAAFVIVAKAPIARLREWAASRGWSTIPAYSSFGTTFNRDFRGEDSDGDQQPSISDLLTPVWNLFDLLPSGRDDYHPNYELA